MKNLEKGNLDWNNYISIQSTQTCFEESFCLCSSALHEQRKIIQDLVQDLNPHRIGCLGSGFLNDVPLETLCQKERDLFLIDWIPDISLEGVRGSIIKEKPGGISCLFCETPNPERFCSSYMDPSIKGQSICSQFSKTLNPNLRCDRYIPGDEPHFINSDITGGRAASFAKQALKLVENSRTPKEVFQKAIRFCKESKIPPDCIAIESGSLDFITSSMLVSQFDSQPYSYFSYLLEHRFGREEILSNEKSLRPLMEVLRSELFRMQMEGHASEIYRLVEKTSGIVYFSVELFCSVPGRETYFLVHEITKALEILSRYFVFDFKEIPPEKALRKTKIGSEQTIIQCYVLRPNHSN